MNDAEDSRTENTYRTGNAGKKKTPRVSQVALGAIPVVILGGLVSMDHIPGTNISLAVPYAAEGKGPTFNTLSDVSGTPVVDVDAGEQYEVDENPAGNLNMTTVSVRTNMTVVQAFGRWIGSDDTIVPIEKIYPPGTDREQFQEQNQAAFTASEDAATVAAMNYLDIPTRTAIAQVLDISAGSEQLADGDVLVKVDGRDVTAPEDVQSAVRSHQPGETIRLEFERDGEKHDEDIELLENPHAAGEALLGITMTSVPDADIDVTYNLQDVGGPSAGMIFPWPSSINSVKVISPAESLLQARELSPRTRRWGPLAESPTKWRNPMKLVQNCFWHPRKIVRKPPVWTMAIWSSRRLIPWTTPSLQWRLLPRVRMSKPVRLSCS